MSYCIITCVFAWVARQAFDVESFDVESFDVESFDDKSFDDDESSDDDDWVHASCLCCFGKGERIRAGQGRAGQPVKKKQECQTLEAN